MTEARHRLFLASAGTGKTFQLTSHLLGLLFRGADPGRLLPTTFTRKAAGEILERVLERVVEAAESEAKRAELSRAVGLDLDEAACRKLLVDLASKLDRFRVGTLDAFFVRLGQLFAFDLGLPPTWRIADPLEEARHKREAIARVLAEDNREELVELLRGLQRGGGGRSLVKAVERVVDEASAMYRESTPEAWTRLEPPPAIEEEELAIAVRNLLAFQPPTNKGNGEPKKHWVNNLAALAELLEAGDWKGLLKNNLVQKVLAGEDSFDKAPISDAFRDILSPLIEQARHEQIVELQRRTEASFALLERYEQALAAVKHERASYGFGDLPRALAPAGPGDQGPFARREIDVAFRLDGQIDHLLLDEFQDTSPLQWRVLEPLAEEILSEHTGERSFFCVGDLKQSIYGWREAEPRLLSEMEERYPVLEREALNDSYRSSHVVLDTVHRVFDRVGEAGLFQRDGIWRRAAQRWREGYARHEAKKDLPGAAVLLQARAKEEGEKPWEPVLDTLTGRVAALAHEAPQASIGILLRSNKPIPGILNRLLEKGIRASGEGGNLLTASAAVLHMISLLHLVDHPGDSAAWFHLRHSPLANVVLGLFPELDPDGESAPVELSRYVRARLLDEGYGSFCATLLEGVLGCSQYEDWDRRRFRQLVDFAYTHDRSAGLRADAFVEVLRERKVEDPDSARVKVMTIHASKGLEFDAVILPELDEGLHPKHAGFVGRRPEATGLLDVVLAQPTKDLLDSSPLLAEVDGIYKERVLEEVLCVLYVAMTRAVHRLEMIVRDPGKDDDLSKRIEKSKYAALLVEHLGCEGPDADGVLWRHPESDEVWFPAGGGGGEPAPETSPSIPRGLGLAPTSRPRSLTRRSPSAEEGGGLVDPGHLLRPRRGALSRGTLLHRWCEEVEWIEDFDLDDEALLGLGAPLEPDPDRRRELLGEFREALERDEIRAALSRPKGGGDLFSGADFEVWRERAFSLVLPDEEGREHLWTGLIDRVVVERDASGNAISAEVIDFKSDRVAGGELEESVAYYRPQLAGYRRVVARITGLDEDAVRMSLLFLHPGKRVQVEP